MADIVFNVAKGSAGEFVRDDATKFGILLLKVAEADATLQDYDTVAQILAAGGGTANVEANFTNYARKTPLTATRTVDDTNNRVDVDVADVTWTLAGGATNNTIAKFIFFYEESAADSGRIPISAHDWAVTTTGVDETATINVFYRGT